MDQFKKASLNSYGWEICLSHEYGKKKLRKSEKKFIKRLSRSKLKNMKEEYYG
jgi:hypothetical protein